MRISIAAVLGVLIVAGRAIAAPAETPPITDVNEVAEKYVKLVLAMGQHDPDYVDAYYGPAEWKKQAAAEKKPLDAIREDAMDLFSALVEMPLPPEGIDRLRFEALLKQLSAIEARVRVVKGEHMKFDEESRSLYDAVAPTLPESHFEEILKQLEAKIPGEGPIHQRYDKWRKSFVIPKNKLDAVFKLAIKECRARTLAHIKLPKEENFKVEYVTGKPWSGYNWYQGNYRSLIQVNTDLPSYVDRAVDRPRTKVIPAIMFTTCCSRKTWYATANGWSSRFTRFSRRNRSSRRVRPISAKTLSSPRLIASSSNAK